MANNETQSRATLLSGYFRLLAEQAELSSAYDGHGASEESPEEETISDQKAEELDLQEIQLFEKLENNDTEIAIIRNKYLGLLEKTPLSRCPFSGDVLSRSIDLAGLDGLFWDYEYPARRKEEFLSTFLAMDGALKLSEPVESFPFTCQIGPETPFVLPRLLQHESVKAVLSSFQLGAHRLYVISYFSEPLIAEIRRVNDIGTYNYSYVDQNGLIQFDFYEDPEKDFELEDWIKFGKLLWICPDDQNLSLKSFLADCPYLGLNGRREPLAISNGKIATKEPPVWIVETGEYLPDETDMIPMEEVAALFPAEEGVYEESSLVEIEAALGEEQSIHGDPAKETGEEESV